MGSFFCKLVAWPSLETCTARLLWSFLHDSFNCYYGCVVFGAANVHAARVTRLR